VHQLLTHYSRPIQYTDFVRAISCSAQKLLILAEISTRCLKIYIDLYLCRLAENSWMLQRDLNRIMNHESFPEGSWCDDSINRML
jgi:hypothetical protein